MDVLEAAREIVGCDAQFLKDSQAYQLQLTKPALALGDLEDIANKMAAIQKKVPPANLSRAALTIFAGDHGVLAEGVSPWPQEVTAQMVGNFLEGGAAANVIARKVGAHVLVVDVGVASKLDAQVGLIDRKVGFGTKNLCVTSAMSYSDAHASMQVGFDIAKDLIGQGYEILATGDMGIGNTTASSALIAKICQADPATVTGRGTGISDDAFARKVAVISKALTRLQTNATELDAVGVLSELGGYEHGAIAGYILGAAHSNTPVILDGLISNAAALIAFTLSAEISGYMFAGHSSRESGAKVALEYLGLKPILDLNMALGEGTGALLALSIIQASLATINEMATFDSAGVSEK